MSLKWTNFKNCIGSSNGKVLYGHLESKRFNFHVEDNDCRILVIATVNMKYNEHCRRNGKFYEVTHCMKIEQLYKPHTLTWMA